MKTKAGHFGWIRVKYEYDPQELTIFDFAYDDTGAHITAGDTGATPPNPTPTPGTGLLFGLGLLAMGANGLRALRRGKTAAEAAATA